MHFDADVIALGHTRDDQAETFLLRLLRGAGARGLAAMHPRRGALIRPLLDCRRATLRDYLASRDVPYIHDESNGDLSIPRNRVRAELLPFLEQRFNPSIVDVLADEADLARDEWRWMAAAEDELWSRACRREGDTWRMQADALAAAPAGAGPPGNPAGDDRGIRGPGGFVRPYRRGGAARPRRRGAGGFTGSADATGWRRSRLNSKARGRDRAAGRARRPARRTFFSIRCLFRERCGSRKRPVS